jgi:hypothetical protein
VPVVPSPKFQLKVYGVVPPDAVAVKVTGLPGVIVVGLKVKLAVKASGLIAIVRVLKVLAPLASVIVTLTV